MAEKTQDDAIEAAFVAGTLPEEDRRTEDRRAPEPVEPIEPTKPVADAPHCIMCGHDGLPLKS